jgi:CDP-2,3-bis-(O-geranylgeranyl)-sn-glycerol synthase
MSPLYEVAFALWFILPAYAANAFPVIFGGGLPLDMGRKFFDGKPVFGSHKTFRGFFAGLIAGVLVSAAQTFVLQFEVASDFARLLPFQFNVFVGFLISCGALIGDLVHSFVKRRIGLVEGAPLPLADQLDFVVGAILFALLFSGSPLPLLTVLIVFVITLPLHLLTNLLAYLLGVKKTPY